MNKKTSSAEEKATQKAGSSEDLWNKHGLDDVFFQRDTFVTYLSILGGVAVGALLTQFLPMVEQVKLSRWPLVLYFLASLCLMVSTWVMISWLALTMKMQIRFRTVIPQFFHLFALCIVCLLVTDPSGWLAASGVFILLHLISNFLYKVTGQWDRWPTHVNTATSTNQWIYLFWMILAFAASLHLKWFPSISNETIWGVVALIGSILTIIKQDFDIERERKVFKIP